MPLTRLTLKNHAQHALMGGTLGSLVTLEQVIDDAGRYLYGMHQWAFAERPPVTLALVGDQDYVELPLDFGQAILIESSNVSITLTTLQELAMQKSTETLATNATAFYGVIVWPAYEGVPATVERRSRLLLFPTPATSGPLATLWYRATWVTLVSDTAVANVPPYAEAMLIALVRAFARGYRDDNLAAELSAIESGAMVNRLKGHDGARQPIGRIRGGAWGLAFSPNWMAMEPARDPA